MRRIFGAIVLLTALALAAPRTERVEFDAGASSKTVSGRIQGYDTLDFLVDARAGQKLSVELSGGNSQTYFNVNPPGSKDVALFNGSLSGNKLADRILPADGDYAVRVYMMRAAAGRGEKSDFKLKISVTGAPLAPLPAGSDALVDKTPYHATAEVPCSYYLDAKLKSCPVGVIRRDRKGTATVVLEMPGFHRSILFVQGRPVASDSPEPMIFSKKDDLTTIEFGDHSERYEIPDVLLLGG